MRRSRLHPDPVRPGPSRGERLRLIAGAVLGLAGGILCLLSVRHIAGTQAGGPGLRDLWPVVAGFAGTVAVFRLHAGWFGHPGLAGLSRAAAGAVLVTVFAPVAAGTLVLPLYGTMFGPLALAVTVSAVPSIALGWIGALVAVHRLLAVHRAERESIFARAPDR